MNKRFTPISVKELRDHFPKVRRGLLHGVHYTLIHRSKPIGELRPLSGIDKDDRDPLRFFANVPDDYRFTSKISAVNLIRREREE